MANIEYISGNESHSSNWGKYYLKGLERWVAKEDFPENTQTKHESYQGYQCNDIPEGTVFSIFEQSGDKRGTHTWIFSLCVTTDAEVNADKAGYGYGKTTGNYRVISCADTKLKAQRLMSWWIDSGNPQSIEFAEWCAQHINKRGLKEIPPMPKEEVPDPLNPTCINIDIEGVYKLVLSKEEAIQLKDLLETAVTKANTIPGDPSNGLSVFLQMLINLTH